jgi:hypothetical protein
VPYLAVKMGRRGVGIELSASYFADSIAYVEAAAQERKMPSLFDMLAAAAAEEETT